MSIPGSMTRRLLTVLSVLACALLAVAPTAGAAKRTKKAAVPTIKSVTPLDAQVGGRLTITGSNLKVAKKDTRVYFMREGGGLLSAKAESARKDRVTVVIPEGIIALLRGTAEARQPTRFQIRVLAGKFGAPTKLGKSPLITALDDTLEEQHGLNPLLADTDGDGVGDGFEYWSAKDLNSAALPYPAKRPWPNALIPDAGIDHDGDGLTLFDEFLLWRYYGNGTVPLNYSAGLQRSVNAPAPTDVTLAYMDMDHDGILSDDERDADGDGLGNWDELYGRMTQTWWDKTYNGTDWPKETRYVNDFPELSHVDPDSDGDGVKDGADDQDHDGLTNQFEIERPGNWLDTYISLATVPRDSGGDPIAYPFPSPLNPWARVQPYNPCKPLWSYTCHLHWPGGYYGPTEDWESIPTADAGPRPSAPWTYAGAELP